MNSWFLYTLGSIIFLSITELIQQNLLNRKNYLSERLSMSITSFFVGSLSILTAIFTNQVKEVLNILQYPYLFLFLIELFSSYFSIYFYLKSFKVKNISISIILMTCSVLVTNFLGILFFKESVSINKTVGIVFILSSIFLINFAKKSFEHNHYFALIAGIMLGINYTIDKQLVLVATPFSYLGILSILIALIAYLVKRKSFNTEIKNLKINILALLFLSGILYFLYNILTLFAYRNGGEVGRIDALNNSYVFIIILVEYILFKQRKNILKKAIAAIFCFIGVFILGYYK